MTSSSSSSSPSASAERRSVRLLWQRWLSAAVEADVWGQADEAQALYVRACHSMTELIPQLQLSAAERDTVTRLRHCLALRAEQLTRSTGALLQAQGRGAEEEKTGHSSSTAATDTQQPQLTLDDMQKLRGVVDDLFALSSSLPLTSAASSAFPVALSSAALARLPSVCDESVISVGEEKQGGEQGEGGSLQPPGVFASGDCSVSLFLSSIGVKDAEVYVNPFLSIVVSSAHGPPVEVQDTPFLSLHASLPRHLRVERMVHLHTPLQRMVDEQLCVFFELRHWKADKKKVSVRLFALMEPEELRLSAERERVALELYRKPTDFTRKRLHLHSVKPLYLNLSTTITSH